ncbi:peptidoglycan-binding domain-containing protein [Streptomyces yaanensis]|uniref:Peptidoglycan-binding domain-containing protein n=1 Tax=Streptomyces yaanensis TaxID=1142239 RepID=A0ABV7SSU3_9ACTN|nr:peptidoglycan-binding domain-containing protein [Streptomyces sp. CGMCC 4.7035]WNB97317.1 peptidoglycan-binding domain-containing protein [Streptomyces sp. CGMCC 4.7035]
MRKHIRTAVAATVLAAGAALGGITAAGTALASDDTGYIDGTGGTTDDWRDEGALKQGDEGNAVALWQTVLVADGAKWTDKKNTKHDFTENDIDGDFDSKTKSATKDWQAQNGLSQTGKADPKSFSVADNNLGKVGRKGYVTYDGDSDYNARFKRLPLAGVAQQVYYVYVDGAWVEASY